MVQASRLGQYNPAATFTNHEVRDQVHMHSYNQLHRCERHRGDRVHDRDGDGDDDGEDDHDHCFLLHQTSSVCGLGWTLAQLS